jgi:hypothetical protein
MATYKSYLKHYDTYIEGQRSGNPYRQKGARFGFKPKYAYDVTYKYNYDPSTGRPIQPGDSHYGETWTQTYATPRGRARYEEEVRRNRQKASNKRADEEALWDPKKWEEEDMNNAINLAKSAQDATRATSDIAGRLMKDPKRGPRYDLSDMSDQELRAILNREQMERQYNDYFNPQQVNSGRETVQNVLGVAGSVATVGLTALQIAQAVKGLRG